MSARQSGFSMIELLIVAFIMGVGLLGLMTLQLMSIRSNTSSTTRATAVYLADGVLADIKGVARLHRSVLSGTVGGAPIYPAVGIIDYAALPYGANTDLYYNKALADAGQKPWVAAPPSPNLFTLHIKKDVATVAGSTGYVQDLFTVSIDYFEPGPGNTVLTKNIQLQNLVSW